MALFKRMDAGILAKAGIDGTLNKALCCIDSRFYRKDKLKVRAIDRATPIQQASQAVELQYPQLSQTEATDRYQLFRLPFPATILNIGNFRQQSRKCAEQ